MYHLIKVYPPEKHHQHYHYLITYAALKVFFLFCPHFQYLKKTQRFLSIVCTREGHFLPKLWDVLASICGVHTTYSDRFSTLSREILRVPKTWFILANILLLLSQLQFNELYFTKKKKREINFVICSINAVNV